MKSRIFLLFGLLTCGDNLPYADSATGSFECLYQPPEGLYFVTFDKLSTNSREPDCGTLSSSNVNVFDGAVRLHDSAGCIMASKGDSPRLCETNVQFECDDGTWEMSLDWAVRPDPTDADRFDGVLRADMVRFTGWTCVGTYRVVGERVHESR